MYHVPKNNTIFYDNLFYNFIKYHGAQRSGKRGKPGNVMGFFLCQGKPGKPGNVMGYR